MVQPLGDRVVAELVYERSIVATGVGILAQGRRPRGCVVEQNGFQRVFVDELNHFPEIRGRVSGSTTTSRGKSDPKDDIPRLKLELSAGSWVIPCADGASLRLARIWQAEFGAFGYRGRRLEGLGEHDDMVTASWLIELAVNLVLWDLAASRQEEIVYGEDVGIERVHIGDPYP